MRGFRKTAKTLKTLWPALERGQPEAVHQARKLTRRAQAELRIARAPKRVRRAWQQLRRALAPVRDRDAAGEHLGSALIRRGVPAEEVAVFQAAWAAGRQSRFAAVSLPTPPPPVARPKRWKERVQEVLHSDAQALLREADVVLGMSEPEPWHQWRKHLKRFRSTLELIGSAPKSLQELLEHLGRMQDAQVVQDLLLQEDWLPQYRDTLLEAEAVACHEAQTQVREVWPKLAGHLQTYASTALSRG